ncbi:hypothetical protein AK812_SmicGene23109 [Symbiodinium microadriaticum]|uniref:Uncharacterized protein n=1 Tax=Symbiodinium microadriaticum TaxID=2951 RepID=A0A1Q9DI11_SYMMI|nr:hypothetical protein AK812_SmicGene23109 [Symbiodinium microadriaticum]
MSKYRGPLDPFLAETFLPISGFTATEYAQGFEKVPGQDQIPSLRALLAADMRYASAEPVYIADLIEDIETYTVQIRVPFGG